MQHWVYKPLGERIRELRKNAGLTQEALAAKLGISRTSVTNIESGNQALPLHALYDFAGHLNVAPSALLPEPSVSSRELDELERAFEELGSAREQMVRQFLVARARKKRTVK